MTAAQFTSKKFSEEQQKKNVDVKSRPLTIAIATTRILTEMLCSWLNL